MASLVSWVGGYVSERTCEQEIGENWSPSNSRPRLDRIAGMGLGMNQLPAALILGTALGSATAYQSVCSSPLLAVSKETLDGAQIFS